MTRPSDRFSRATASAEALSNQPDVHRFIDKGVLLTGDLEVLTTENGAEMAGASLQLLMRICKHVDVFISPVLSGLAADLEKLGNKFAWDEPPRFINKPEFLAYDAILSVGGTVRGDLPWTAISSNGWLLRVSSGPTPISADCGNANPIGALAAASFGVCDVFKRLIVLKPELGDLLDGVTFSLWDYSVGGNDAGPAITPEIAVNLLVNGVGAIGSALIHLLVKLPLTGRVTVVDNQTYGEENWGTCIDLARNEVSKGKAPTAASRLGAGVRVTAYVNDVKSIVQTALGTEVPWPTVVLNGLDNIDPRHHSQQVWPHLLIDGAIDSNFTVQVSAHPHDSNTACLICLFRHPPGEAAEVMQARVTGLSAHSLDHPEADLLEADVLAAEPDHQAWLRSRLGRTICSIVSEAQQLSAGRLADSFAPSVPFVACLSACMVTTELVRHVMAGRVGVHPRYQMSLLTGPNTGMMIPERRHGDCFCVQRRANIDRVRRIRYGACSADVKNVESTSVSA